MKHTLIFLILWMIILPAKAENLLESAHSYESSNSDASQNQPTETTQAGWSTRVQEILLQAFSLTGIQYKYGGNSPETGFDCSGFVRYVFQQATRISLPPTARAISQLGQQVRKEELQPGDLVFFNTLKSTFSHVGIYIGDHKFIHSPRAGGSVRVEDMNNSYWKSRFNGAQRLDKVVEEP